MNAHLREKKSNSTEMQGIKAAFLKKWKNEFVGDGWIETRNNSRPHPYNSISVLKFENNITEIGYALIEAAQLIDEKDWL
jgi:hypothetical protein